MSKKKVQAEKLADEQERIEKTLNGIDSVSGENGHDQDTITLSTGVVLRLKPISKQLIRTVQTQFERPEVPMWEDPNKGRQVENPSDPKYIEAVEQYMVEIANATMDVCILRGTEVLEKPDDLLDPDSEQWVYEMQTLGLPMGDNPRARYLAWIKGVAAPLDRDMNLVMGVIGRMTGVSETDVLEAVSRFRRVKR